MIQAAVSREREYLADASATQFTRHPAGLSSALRKLQKASSTILHPEAGAASHLFFGASSASLFATHPPLTDRIHRLGGILLDLPNEKRTFPFTPETSFGENERTPPILTANPHAAMPVAPPALLGAAALAEEESLTQAQFMLASLPEDLRKKSRSIVGATGILGGLLFSKQDDIRAQQEKMLPPDSLPIAKELYQWFYSRMELGGRFQLAPSEALPTEQELYQRLSMHPEEMARYRLVWLDLILPVLREVLEAERQQLLAMTKDLIKADGRVSPTEFAIYSILRSVLLPPMDRRVKRSELRPEQLDQDIAGLLALLTYAGHDDAEIAQAAYQAAMNCSPADEKHPFPTKAGLSLNKISDSLSRLALAAPPYRKKLLHACEVAVRYDGKITPVENELLRAFAQSLDCPAPLS
jgi:hypothetical protein